MNHFYQFLNVMVMLKVIIEPLYELAVLFFVVRMMKGVY